MEHSSVCWTGSWYNAFVHTIMYSYYTLNAIGWNLSSVKQLVTMLQLLQFVTILGHIGWLNAEGGWNQHPLTFLLAYTVYGSYLVLFMNFFYKTYFAPKKSKAKSHTE